MKNKGSIIPFITVDGIRIYDSNKIASEFGKFYSTLGSELASKIMVGRKSVEEYVQQIPRELNSLVLKGTTPAEIEQIIKSLPMKTSYGHDSISNEMLKSLNEAVSLSLCWIFNQ